MRTFLLLCEFFLEHADEIYRLVTDPHDPIQIFIRWLIDYM